MHEPPGVFLWLSLVQTHWKRFAIYGALGGVSALTIALFLPLWFEARTSVLPPHEERRSLPQVTRIAGALQMDDHLPFSAEITLLDIYLGILKSETLANALMEQYDLRNYYQESKTSEILGILRSRTKIATTKNGIIELKVEDKDPEMAAALAQGFVTGLDEIFRKTRSTAGRRQRVFLESRIQKVLAELDSTESVLTEMQSGKGVTVLSRDLGETAVVAGDLLGKRLALSVQLELLGSGGGGSTPARDALDLELKAVEKQIAALPQVGAELGAVLRDLRMLEVLYEELSQQLEAARIEEARDTPTVVILDPARVPDTHVRPRRSLVVLAGLLTGCLISFLQIVFQERRQYGDPLIGE